MEYSSPPITPTRYQYTSPIDTSPTSSYRERRRRTSSLSSNHNRSPVSVRSNKRFSNASIFSNDFSPDGGGGGGGGGMGNLADELGQWDDEYEDEDTTESVLDDTDKQLSPIDGARDSGIDVSYPSRTATPRIKTFSKPFSTPQKAAVEEKEDTEDRLSPELEDLISSIARMASYASTSEDPLIPRVLALLQDLGNQSGLETGVQRLTTSTNSMASHLMSQSKSLQGLMTSLYSPLAMFSAPLDPEIVEETLPWIDALLQDLPQPDTTATQGLQKLVRETDNVIQTLSQLTDTVQMGKHTTNTASRHLRTNQTAVAEIRREREKAEEAREELRKNDWNDRIRDRWCAGECRDIMGGFEELCDSLRENLIQEASA
ncbi:hypothetical protein LTR37_016895 [Vermiconidia calcicola]|uniref:Uncharacterized protein n=1 Tax=Vermiconidia calcicola TaxID=1690605 RepID=A0ACC3MLL7_9PEZI|nr:hypothetical protein LTR37_016895 [Vermiconidia calcicola]